MKPQQSLGEFMQISSESMDGLVIGANLENEDMNFIPALSLEHAAREAALADGLIENGVKGAMKPKKIGLRRGKWTQEEETYANKLIHEFKLGTLPLTDGTTLRTFLSKLLNCDPMRISKKFVGAKCIGKQVFRRRSPDLDKLTPEQIESNKNDLAELERNFLDRVSQTNKVKGNGEDEEPEAEPVWSDGDGHRATRGRTAGLNGAHPAGAHPLYGMYGDQMPRTESASEMLDFQNIMNGSSGGLSQLANFATSPFPSYYGADGSPYRGGGGGYGRGAGFPHASSLEVLCAMPGAESLDNFGGLYKNDSFSWAKGGELGAAAPVDIMTLNSSYYSNAGAAGGAGGGGPARGEGGYFASGASLPYSSSAEWPSMNNLVVAAETIEHLGSMNSLLGGGLMESIANFRALQGNAPAGETFPMAATHPLNSGRNSAEHNSNAGEQLSVRDVAAASSFSSLQDRASNRSRATNSDHSIKEGAAGEASAAAGEAPGQDNNVGLSIDEDDDDVPSTGSSAQQSSTTLSINKEVLAEVEPDAGGVQDATPITNMLRANDLYQARVAAVEAANAAHRQSTGKTGSGHVPPQMSDLVPKNSSISDFWMLVGLGDLPRPDQDVLSSSLWPSGSEKTSTSTTSERSGPLSEPAAVTPPSPIKQVGSPRITPDQLPPHLQKALLESSLAKHSRQSSTDSLAASRGSTGTDDQPLTKRLRAAEPVATAVGGGNR